MSRGIKILERRCVPPGTLIIEQGASGSHAYLIEAGRVEVFMTNPVGEKIVINELGPGALIGEIALLDDGFRTASVRTLAATTLVSISAHDFKLAMAKSKKLQNTLTNTMAHRLQQVLSILLNRKTVADETEILSLVDKLKATLRRVSARLMGLK